MKTSSITALLAALVMECVRPVSTATNVTMNTTSMPTTMQAEATTASTEEVSTTQVFTTPTEVFHTAAATSAMNESVVAVFTNATNLTSTPSPYSPASLPSVLSPAPAANATPAVRAQPANTDLGPCVCDLTASYCDANCECDTVSLGRDCTSTELALFTNAYTVPIKISNASSIPPALVPLCVSPDTFLKINSPTVLDNSPLCVARNNNPSSGYFFIPQPDPVTNDKVRIEFNNKQYGVWLPSPSFYELVPSGTYRVGMPISIAHGEYLTSKVDSFIGLRHFSLPYPGPNGMCQEGNLVRYWDGTAPGLPCMAGGLVKDACQSGSSLAASKYLSNRYIAKVPLGTDIATWSDITKWLEIQVDAYLVQRSANGTLLNTFSLPSLLSPKQDNTNNVCENVLESIRFNVVLDGSGGISSVKAVVRIRDKVPYAGTSEVWMTQMFDATFLNVQNEGKVTAVARAEIQRSGNPGYVTGKPILAGLSTADASGTTVIEQLLDGLTLPNMADSKGFCRVCPSGSGSAWPSSCTTDPGGSERFDERERVQVLFNEDIRLGCQLSLTRSQLASFCAAGSLHPFLRYPDSLRLGIWGNSDPSNYLDWVPNNPNQQQLADSPGNPSTSQAWDPRGNCSNVVNSLNFEILTADEGSLRNPQQKIIGARVVYGQSMWMAQEFDDSKPNLYTITATVSFLKIANGGAVEVMPPVPSVLPVLPNDIFYPFTGAASSCRPGRWQAMSIFLVSAGMAMLIQKCLV